MMMLNVALTKARSSDLVTITCWTRCSAVFIVCSTLTLCAWVSMETVSAPTSVSSDGSVSVVTRVQKTITARLNACNRLLCYLWVLHSWKVGKLVSNCRRCVAAVVVLVLGVWPVTSSRLSAMPKLWVRRLREMQTADSPVPRQLPLTLVMRQAWWLPGALTAMVRFLERFVREVKTLPVTT